jgi:hypothetical protein
LVKLNSLERRKAMKKYEWLPKGVMAATVIASGIAFAAFGAAMADTDRTDCVGNNCVRVHCDDDNGTCTQTTNFDVRGQNSHVTDYRTISDTKPMRYACDSDGMNCHWTRSYYTNDFGEPIYDPGAAP